MGTVGYNRFVNFDDRKIIEKMYNDYSDRTIAKRINMSQQAVSGELKKLERKDYTAKKAEKAHWKQIQSRSMSLPRIGVSRRCRDSVNLCLRINPNMELKDIAELFSLDIEDVEKVYEYRLKRLAQKK